MANTFEGQIYSATYSGVPVYELRLGSESVMRRRFDGYINATHILKIAGLDKPARTRILEREVQKGIHQKVQGGYGKYQGTWIPLDTGRELARRIRILDRLLPIFDFDPTAAASPPPVPKPSSSSSAAAKASKALRSLTGSSSTLNGRRKGVASRASSSAAGSSSRRTISAPANAAANAAGLRDPYLATAAAAATATATAGGGIPAGYVPANGRPRRMGARYVDEGGDVGSSGGGGGGGLMSSTVASGSTPVRDGVGGDEMDDEDMEIDARGGRMQVGEVEGGEDDDDEEEDEFDVDYKMRYNTSTTTRGGGNGGVAKAMKRKRNAKVDHPRRPYRQSQLQQQQQQDLRNDPYYAVETTLGAATQQQQQQHEEALQQQTALDLDLDDRERNHIIYSDQLLDYFMTVGDSTRTAIPPPTPPPTFEVDRPVDDKGNTALHWACAMGDISIVEDLIARGANVSVRTHMDETPLVRAVLFTNNFEKHTMPKLVDLLCATLTLRDWYGATVFNHLAATTQSRGKWRSARYYAYVLLEKMRRVLAPAEIRQVLSSVDFDGDTAALKAARNGCTRLARMLLTYGPEAWDVVNKVGESARGVLERAARRKEEREREKERERGDKGRGIGGRDAMYPSPIIAGHAQGGNGGNSQTSMSSQTQRIDPQLSAAAVEAVNNVNAHAQVQQAQQAQAQYHHHHHHHAAAPSGLTQGDPKFSDFDSRIHQISAAHNQSQQQQSTAATTATTTSAAPLDTSSSSSSNNPSEEILAQIAPILQETYRKLTAAFGSHIPADRNHHQHNHPATTTTSGGDDGDDGDSGIDISDPKSLYNHLEKDRANIRRQVEVLREEETKGGSVAVEKGEEEYERIRAVYEDLIERVQEREIRRRIEREGEGERGEKMDGVVVVVAAVEGGEKEKEEGKEEEEEEEEGKDDDSAFVHTYKLLQLLAQGISTRRQKVQELIDGYAEAGFGGTAATTTTTTATATATATAAETTTTASNEHSGGPANPNLRHLVALATGLKESELDEMAGELEATLNFEKLGSVAGGIEKLSEGRGRREGRVEDGGKESDENQEPAGGGGGGGGGAPGAGAGAGAGTDMVITESQKTVEMDVEVEVDPAMERQERQERQEAAAAAAASGQNGLRDVSNAKEVEIMN